MDLKVRESRSSGGPGSRRVSNVLFSQLHGDGVEENVASAAGVEGVSHCRSITDRAAHAPSLVLTETMGRAKHAVGGKEKVDGRDGRGGLHVWAPCVQKGDFESPCGDRCGKGSHTCMAPLHPKRKGRLCTEKKSFYSLELIQLMGSKSKDGHNKRETHAKPSNMHTLARFMEEK
uniref:Uncharacterized protein n=1 Tax=Vitis vinifera TaxID=29760 RepID=F6I4C5_VITVI